MTETKFDLYLKEELLFDVTYCINRKLITIEEFILLEQISLKHQAFSCLKTYETNEIYIFAYQN